MTSQLKRITTEYINIEDRIRLNGLTAGGTVSIWLTQRLCNYLVINLISWLEKNMPETPGILQHDMQSFAQQSANYPQQQSAPSTLPVRPDSETSKHKSWLAFSIQIQTTTHTIRLIISDLAETESIEFNMEPKQLRQWLNILHKTYNGANWPDHVWPEWIKETLTHETAAQHPVH